MDIILVTVITLMGVGFFASLGTFSKKDCLFVFSIVVALALWLIFAAVQPTEYVKVSMHDIHSKSLDSGEQFQYSFIGNEIVSVTKLFPSIYPNTFKLEKKVVNKWSCGIYFITSHDTEYSIINSDGIKVISEKVHIR